jgi:hypothetical protein
MNMNPSMTHQERPSLSTRQLWQASGAAALVAALVLTVAVLPAEYGLDPTGLGQKLGLTRLHTAEQAAEAMHTTALAADPVQRRTVAYKTQEMTLTLLPNSGAEIKAVMQAGDSFVFNWTSAAPVEVDMHGEPFQAPSNVFTSYWKENASAEAHGSFTAPFGGTHGWYWHNAGAEAVNVTVTVSGYFETLYMP